MTASSGFRDRHWNTRYYGPRRRWRHREVTYHNAARSLAGYRKGRRASTFAEEILRFFGDPFASRIEVRPSVSADGMQELYARHDVFVPPSIVEGPDVLMEAMAGGMPVIATETCGMSDIIENDFNGLLIPPAYAGALEKAIARLAEGEDLRRRWGRPRVKQWNASPGSGLRNGWNGFANAR